MLEKLIAESGTKFPCTVEEILEGEKPEAIETLHRGILRGVWGSGYLLDLLTKLHAAKGMEGDPPTRYRVDMYISNLRRGNL